jgi:hypothetical protein
MGEQPSDRYEQPSVEQVDTEDSPAVTAAGDQTDGQTTTVVK